MLPSGKKVAYSYEGLKLVILRLQEQPRAYQLW